MATIPKRQVSGRPKKSEAAKRKYKVSTKLTAPECYAFKAKLRAARLIASEYIRQAIEKSEVVERLSPEHREEIRQLIGMANNINQLAHRANREGFYPERETCIRTMEQIDEIVRRLHHDG
jgi:replicative DNA helicase